MLRFITLIIAFLTSVPPVLALDLPARRSGLWELTITPSLTGEPARQCMDATVDQLFWRRDLGDEMVEHKLCRANVSNSDGAITADLACSFGKINNTEISNTTHLVFSGDFESAYTMEVTTTQAPINGLALPPLHLTTAYKYIGPCEADQQPGDFITTQGKKIQLFGDPAPANRP
jgi:hypothetical protein